MFGEKWGVIFNLYLLLLYILFYVVCFCLGGGPVLYGEGIVMSISMDMGN